MDKLAALVERSPVKAQHVTLAVVLGGIEDSTSKGTWRYPEASNALYFAQLAAWGYGLSDVEQLVVDVNSVLLRRDAADRARRVTDEAEALAVLGDADRSGDDSLAHAVGHRARQAGWVDTLDAYQEARPGSADSAVALAFVEGLATDPGYNLANGITYSAPLG